MSSTPKTRNISDSHFVNCFGNLEDSRNQMKIRYPMSEVLFLVISSVLSGYESNRGIEEFGTLKLDWLRQYFPYKHGIPNHETIGNIIGLIDKSAFEIAFMEWVDLEFGIHAESLIHIDGKRIRSSVEKRLQDKKSSQGGKNAELILNAYGSSEGKVIAQINVSDSGDEQEGAKRLVDQLNLRGKTITGDGNFCIKDILKRIRSKKGNYLMALKRNNPKLYDLSEQYFKDFVDQQQDFQTQDIGHGREEIRSYASLNISVCPNPKFKEYEGLLKIIKVDRKRKEVRTNKTSSETCYYITSLDKGIEYLANAIRNHWSVENNLHWVLDVEFKEDDSKKRTGNQASNFSLIRKIAINMINDKKGRKSTKALRMACAVSDQVRQNILGIP